MLIDSEPNVNPPLIKHFTEKFKNLLSMITTLKAMEVIPIDLSFPKIIVLGDASVGKTSVISTLVDLSLPRVALDIPLVIKFEKYFRPYTKLYLRYHNQIGNVKEEVSEADLGARILAAVRLVPQDDKLDSSVEVLVMQPYVSDLTVIELPGIRPYPHKDQQKEEFKVIRGYHLKHTECVYLHVISGSVDFSSCESAKLLKYYDPVGLRTVNVVTKMDLCSNKHILTQLYSNKIITRYFFVKNVIGDETISELAINKEYYLSGSSIISVLEKKNIGFDIVAKNVIRVMLSILMKPWSPIVERVYMDLKECVNHKFNKITDAPTRFLSIVGSSQHSLYKLFISDEYDEYEEEVRMHPYPRLVEILKEFSSDLQELDANNGSLFLEDEIQLLDASNHGFFCIEGFVSPFIFRSLLRKQISNASNTVGVCVGSVWRYVEFVVGNVLLDHAKYSQQLNSSLKTSASKMIDRMRENFVRKMLELLESEKMFFHWSNPGFLSSWEKYKLNAIDLEKEVVTLEGLGDIEVGHLKKYSERTWQQAFKLKMVMAAYWEALVKRFVDNFSVNLMSSITKMVNGGMQAMMTEDFNERGQENDKESPMDCLKQRIEYLVQAKKEIEKLQQEEKYFLG